MHHGTGIAMNIEKILLSCAKITNQHRIEFLTLESLTLTLLADKQVVEVLNNILDVPALKKDLEDFLKNGDTSFQICIANGDFSHLRCYYV